MTESTRESFEKWIHSKWPQATMKRGIRGAYIVEGLQSKWVGYKAATEHVARELLKEKAAIIDAYIAKRKKVNPDGSTCEDIDRDLTEPIDAIIAKEST